MKLTFTNAFGNKGEVKKTEIEINGKCVITNYDVRTHTPNNAGDLTVTVNGETSSVKKGATIFQEDSSTVNMNDKKYSIFTAIAGLDGNASNLTEEDLEKAKNHFSKNDKKWKTLLKLGVTEIRYDKKAGVATIVIGDNELLRIDFETKHEIKNTSAQKSNAVDKTEKNSTVNKQPKADMTKIAEKSKFKAYNEAVSNVARNMGISEEEVLKYVAKIADETGATTTLVMHLLSTEQFIRKAKNIGDGVITVGFGHTTNAEHYNKFKTDYEISNEEAFAWFEQDIKDKTQKAKKYFNDCNWDEIPASIKEAIIDIAFNRGDKAMREEDIYKSLRENLKLGREYDPASAVRTRQEYKTPPDKRSRLQIGVMKRNCYRFLMAIDSLSAEYKLAAMRRFESGSEPYYTTTIKQLKRIGYNHEANTLKNDWETIKKEAENAVNKK